MRDINVQPTLQISLASHDITQQEPINKGMQAKGVVDHSPRWMVNKMKGIEIGWKKKFMSYKTESLKVMLVVLIEWWGCRLMQSTKFNISALTIQHCRQQSFADNMCSTDYIIIERL